MNGPDKHRGRSHAHRDDLTGEHSFSDAGQLLFAVLFGVIWIADTFFLRWTTGLNQLVSQWIRIPFAAVVLILSGWSARSGLKVIFGEIRETPTVVRDGIFGVVRHPVYLSEILMYVGCLILSPSWAAAIVGLPAGVFLYYLCRHEEKLLLDRFGKEYEDYMRDVGMWFPKVFKKTK